MNNAKGTPASQVSNAFPTPVERCGVLVSG